MEIFYGNTKELASAKLRMAHTVPDFHGNQTIPISHPIFLYVKIVVSRLKESPTLFNLYNNIILDQEKRGFIEILSPDHQLKQAHYLPHHPVKKETIITPIRIVFEGNFQQRKGLASLNDCLLVGTPFLNDLCSILLHF